MTNSRAIIISFAMAALAIALVYFYIDQREKTLLDLAGVVPVVVATQNIEEMTMVDKIMVRIDHLPKKYLQPGVMQELDLVVGKIASVPVKAGEQVLDTKLLDPGSKTGLAYKITPGMRAMTIPVSDVHGVARLIQPGNRVDILSSVDYGTGDREEREVKTVLQDVLVLATGKNITNDVPMEMVKDPVTGEVRKVNLSKDTNFATVTVEVDPIQGQTLTYLMTAGEGILFLSLRNPDDRSRYNLFTTDLDRVLGSRSVKGRREQVRAQNGPRWLEIRSSTISPGF
ncbi:MAG: Flp pilus assembly protein CpaB [Deltaproteobacteria bacterium]|nr:Flp pilus assembly protein CpaB [Deltaproteobacteria bacterium]